MGLKIYIYFFELHLNSVILDFSPMTLLLKETKMD